MTPTIDKKEVLLPQYDKKGTQLGLSHFDCVHPLSYLERLKSSQPIAFRKPTLRDNVEGK